MSNFGKLIEKLHETRKAWEPFVSKAIRRDPCLYGHDPEKNPAFVVLSIQVITEQDVFGRHFPVVLTCLNSKEQTVNEYLSNTWNVVLV